MRVTALAAALIVSLAPGLALAECSWGNMKDHAAVSCADGTTWDATAQACVETVG